MPEATSSRSPLAVREGDRSPLNKEFFRYLAASAIALFADYLTLTYLTEIVGLHYLTSASIAFCMGVLITYLASIYWIFEHRTYQNRWIEAAIFISIGILGLALNAFLMWIFTEKTGFHYLISKSFSAGCVFFFNFLSRRIILFYKN